MFNNWTHLSHHVCKVQVGKDYDHGEANTGEVSRELTRRAHGRILYFVGGFNLKVLWFP